jgi:hypothetical protein
VSHRGHQTEVQRRMRRAVKLAWKSRPVVNGEREENRGHSTARSERARARYIPAPSPASLIRTGTVTPSRASRLVFRPPDCAVSVRKPAACLRVRVLRSHGEVAVLREGAAEQGRVDQGGGRAAGGVHEGARGSVLAVGAQGGGAAALRKQLQAQVDLLPPAGHQAGQLHRRGGRVHHPPAQHPRQQVCNY